MTTIKFTTADLLLKKLGIIKSVTSDLMIVTRTIKSATADIILLGDEVSGAITYDITSGAITYT